nr:kelch repeat-containing protein At3g27220-like [Tanacetum cinerariifolium]
MMGSTDHWSVAVKNGKALEKTWRKEVPIPRGGPHRACVAAGDQLYVIGGQEGDFMPKPGSPIFKCSRRHEVCSSNSTLEGQTSCDGGWQGESSYTQYRSLECCSQKWQSVRENMEERSPNSTWGSTQSLCCCW